MIIGVVLGRLHVLLTFLDGSSIIRLNNFKDCRECPAAFKADGTFLHKYYLSETSAAALAAFAALRFCASALLALRRAASGLGASGDSRSR